MLYHLFTWFGADVPGSGLFTFISFRAAMAVFVSLLISLWWGKGIINLLRRMQVGETVRDLGLEGQLQKQGTPTMGGLIILSATIIPTLLFAKLNNIYIILLRRHSAYALRRLDALAECTGAKSDPAFLDRFAQFQLDLYGLTVSFQSYADALRNGGSLGADASFLKIWATELFQRITHEMLELSGEQATMSRELDFDGVRIDVMNQYLEARPPTIFGGSNEIQRNILAKVVLNLP